MEQMKFEMGDLQQDAPKRMRKRRPPRKKARGLLLVILLVLAAVAAFVLLDRTAFDGLRRSLAYMQAEKDESGCAKLYQYSGDGTSCWMTRETPCTIHHCRRARWLSLQRTAARRCTKSAERACTCWTVRAW